MTERDPIPYGSLRGRDRTIQLAELSKASILRSKLERLRGASVVIAVQDQLTAAIAMIELDGVARRMVLCTPDLPREQILSVAKCTGSDALLCDSDMSGLGRANVGICFTPDQIPSRYEGARTKTHDTEWILLTSGTTGTPKLVLHDLRSLKHALAPRTRTDDAVVWSTFYDIRRYGGLQILLRGLRSGSMILSSPNETIADYLARAGAAGVTNISGTPSHWRYALMSGAAAKISPRTVRLSGEIADQAILDALRSTYCDAAVVHAFASTEAGVAFEITDGRAGFPASWVGPRDADVQIEVESGSLRVSSAGNAKRYLNEDIGPLVPSDGFVDTNDQVELRDGRYYFIGRRDGVINVGGLKVYAEEVEALINSHPNVRMSLVKGRRNPIMGEIVTAEVVLIVGPSDHQASVATTLCSEIIDLCRRNLSTHQVPAMIRIVSALPVSASGKLLRAAV